MYTRAEQRTAACAAQSPRAKAAKEVASCGGDGWRTEPEGESSGNEWWRDEVAGGGERHACEGAQMYTRAEQRTAACAAQSPRAKAAKEVASCGGDGWRT